MADAGRVWHQRRINRPWDQDIGKSIGLHSLTVAYDAYGEPVDLIEVTHGPYCRRFATPSLNIFQGLKKSGESLLGLYK